MEQVRAGVSASLPGVGADASDEEGPPGLDDEGKDVINSITLVGKVSM